MTDQVERLPAACPACSPDFETVHEVLKSGSGQATVRCTDCGHVHKMSLVGPELVTRDVVVSQDDESFTATVDAPADEPVRVGEEFVLDTDEAIMAVRITALEIAPERRVEEATARDVETFWTRAVDNVYVNVTIHPATGDPDRTQSVKFGVPGDYEFEVGEVAEVSDDAFVVEKILVRDDATGYPTDNLDREGDTAVAKDIKRVYAHEDAPRAWSAW